MIKNTILPFLSTLIVIIVLLVSSCASVQAPTGGPRDTIPPKVVEEIPKNQSRNFNSKIVKIRFDEFVKLVNEYQEISMTPVPENMPVYKAKKENLQIEFSSPLEPNTTYTINFGKGLTDVNESNVLKNYTYVFATGDKLDSLSLSGQVYSTLTQEKVKEATVSILPTSQDSLFGKKRAAFFTITDTAGKFEMRNLREDNYRIYALLEAGGGDRIYNNPNEEIGFVDTIVRLNRNISDIRIETFKAAPQVFTIQDRKIDQDGKILVSFNKRLKSPDVQFPGNPELNTSSVTEFSPNKDSVYIWQNELTFDSLSVAIGDNGVPLDTIILRRNKRDSYNRTITFADNIGSRLKPGGQVIFKLSNPIQNADQTKISILEDSTAVKNYQLTRQPNTQREYLLRYPWRPQKEYTVKFEEGSFTDIFGTKSKPHTRKFIVDTQDSYGNIALKIVLPDTTSNYIIQWLNERNDILRETPVSAPITLNYTNYPTGKYKIRVIYDTNKNGQWDTGDIREFRQPEKIWIYEKLLSLRPNWDLEETLTIPAAKIP